MKIGKLLIDEYVDVHDNEKYIKVYENVIMAKGGDGTLLRAINMYRHLKKPFWGVNGGTLGFLMNEREPHHYIKDDIDVINFQLIKITVVSKTWVQDVDDETFGWIRCEETFQAFNDIMIGKDMNSYIEFSIKEKDDLFNTFHGGGLIISTPAGSTGINKNNDGVVLPLKSNLWSFTGDKTAREINYVLKPRVTQINVKSRDTVNVWVDGQNHIIENVEQVTLRKGDIVKVAFGNPADFKKKRRL